jgi:osmotically-inducible protein OsmY
MLAVLALAAYLLGFWSPDGLMLSRWRRPTSTTGPVDTGGVRGRVDQLGVQASRAGAKVDAFVSDTELTGKIKSKMALDDVVRARTIDVSTTAGVVTLGGTVRSVAEREQAVRLARETKGVTRVVDHLAMLP